MRDWETGKILNQYNLDYYEKEWGNVYNMLHRQDMHATLLKAATSSEGKGTPCAVNIDHMYVHSAPMRWFSYVNSPFSCHSVDAEAGTVTFQNGVTVKADLIIGADGIRVSSVLITIASEL